MLRGERSCRGLQQASSLVAERLADVRLRIDDRPHHERIDIQFAESDLHGGDQAALFAEREESPAITVLSLRVRMHT